MLLRRLALVSRTLQWFKARLPCDDRTILLASDASGAHSLVTIGAGRGDSMALKIWNGRWVPGVGVLLSLAHMCVKIIHMSDTRKG